VEYTTATDEQVLEAVVLLARSEGILAALESAHALAWIVQAARSGDLAAGSTVLMTLSGRGDKDAGQLMDLLA
jgi:tryptophan synthase beta chain